MAGLIPNVKNLEKKFDELIENQEKLIEQNNTIIALLTEIKKEQPNICNKPPYSYGSMLPM